MLGFHALDAGLDLGLVGHEAAHIGFELVLGRPDRLHLRLSRREMSVNVHLLLLSLPEEAPLLGIDLLLGDVCDGVDASKPGVLVLLFEDRLDDDHVDVFAIMLRLEL